MATKYIDRLVTSTADVAGELSVGECVVISPAQTNGVLSIDTTTLPGATYVYTSHSTGNVVDIAGVNFIAGVKTIAIDSNGNTHYLEATLRGDSSLSSEESSSEVEYSTETASNVITLEVDDSSSPVTIVEHTSTITLTVL